MRPVADPISKIPAATALIDENGKIVEFNKQFSWLLGLSSHDRVKGESFLKIWKGHVQEPATFELDEFSRTDQTQRLMITLHSGKRKYVHLQVEDTTNDQCLITIEDRTNRQQTDSSHFTLKKALLALEDKIAILDATGGIIFANWLPEWVVGRDINDVLYSGKKFDEDGNYLCQAVRALETGEDIVDQISEHPLTNRVEKVSAKRLFDYQGDFIGVLYTYTDITKEYELQQRVSQLEKLQALGEMAAATAHEIKNPLTAISALAQMGIHTKDQDKKDQAFNKIINQIRKMNEFLNDLTVLSRVEGQRVRPADPHQLLEDVLELVCGEVELKNIAVFLDFCQLNQTIQLAPTLFKQAMLNVLQNAIEAVPENSGQISITTRYSASQFAIEVRDNGPGIPKEVANKIGTPFLTTKSTGTGLGLAITMQIVHTTHHGNITFTSNPGEGTAVLMQFPLN